nr:hypothetical protein [uncultured Draconibacterium sp.]
MTDKKKLKNISLAVVFVIASCVYLLYWELSSNKIEKDGKYTTGIVTDFKMNFRNGYNVYYKYTVAGIEYNESLMVSEDYNNIKNSHFFVKFDPDCPDHSFIILDKPALSKFWNAPPEGWEEIPK